ELGRPAERALLLALVRGLVVPLDVRHPIRRPQPVETVARPRQVPRGLDDGGGGLGCVGVRAGSHGAIVGGLTPASYPGAGADSLRNPGHRLLDRDAVVLRAIPEAEGHGA